MISLESLKEMMVKCSHCAGCEAVCPVYLETLSEPMVARNRVEVIRETLYNKSMPFSDRAREILDCCLLCTNCTQNCGSRVEIDDIVIAARAYLHDERGGSLKTAAVGMVLTNRKLAGLLSKVGYVVQRVGFASNVPKVAGKTFDKYYSGTVKAEGETRGRVAYFVGCGTNFMWPDTGVATVKVLTANGIEVVIPENQACCGIPAMAEGDLKSAGEMVRTNVQIFAGMDAEAIVTDCTSCGMMLKEKYAKMLPDDDPLQEKVKVVSGKIFEVTDYLAKVGLAKKPGRIDKVFTYHAPCHRNWTRTVGDAPLKVLTQIPGTELREMDKPERCCGAGGTFYMGHSEIAQGIRSRRIDQIEETGADTVVTQCPICRFYIEQGLEGAKAEVVHPMVMLARAYAFDLT